LERAQHPVARFLEAGHAQGEGGVPELVGQQRVELERLGACLVLQVQQHLVERCL
jgi:hypothetical protein